MAVGARPTAGETNPFTFLSPVCSCILGNLRVSILAALFTRMVMAAMLDGIHGVLAGGSPLKVIDVVIRSVAVEVPRLHPLWMLPNKRLDNYPVGALILPFALFEQSDSHVPIFICSLLEDFSSL